MKGSTLLLKENDCEPSEARRRETAGGGSHFGTFGGHAVCDFFGRLRVMAGHAGHGGDVIPAHNMDVDEVLAHFQVSAEDGLTTAQVEASRARWGRNELSHGEKTPLWKLVLEQFEDPLVITLMGAMFISLGTNMYDYYNPHGAEASHSFWEGFVEPSVIFFILVFNALVGVWQESNAESALEALKNLQAEKVRTSSCIGPMHLCVGVARASAGPSQRRTSRIPSGCWGVRFLEFLLRRRGGWAWRLGCQGPRASLCLAAVQLVMFVHWECCLRHAWSPLPHIPALLGVFSSLCVCVVACVPALAQAVVFRNGTMEEIDAKDVVPGDVVLVKVGDKVPADCRVIKLETSAFGVCSVVSRAPSAAVVPLRWVASVARPVPRRVHVTSCVVVAHPAARCHLSQICFSILFAWICHVLTLNLALQPPCAWSRRPSPARARVP